MALLNSIYLEDYKAQLPKPADGTCRWILTHPAYLDWTTTEETGLLWVMGEPGCGKTMLSTYLTDNMQLACSTLDTPQIFFFFCDDKVESQRDATAILRALLYQILRQRRGLIKHVNSRVQLEGPSIAHSFRTLWELFLKVLADITSRPVGIIVDAIDECEVKTRNRFLDAITQLVKSHRGLRQQSKNCVKFFITSRPSLGSAYDLTGLGASRLSIEQNRTSISEDMKLIIRCKVGDITRKFQCDIDTKLYLEHALYTKADQSFLWLTMVLRSLERSAKGSRADFQEIIDGFPRGLEDTYAAFLLAIAVEYREDAGKLLRLLIGSSNPLTLKEINAAFTINQNHKSVARLRRDLQPSISATLQTILGSFVRISDRRNSDENTKVSLIHQSAKDFLTNPALHAANDIVPSLAVSLPEACMSIAQSCMRYLLLQEFQSDLLGSKRSSIETGSPPTSLSSPPSSSFNTPDSGEPLGGDDGFDLGNLFKDKQEMDEEQCAMIAQDYDFFDYAAIHWPLHYSRCESSAPKFLREAARRLTASSSCVLKNWLRYYWFKSDMEYPLPTNFETMEVAAFFNLPLLLGETLQTVDLPSKEVQSRALFWAARMSSMDCISVLLQHGVDPNGIGMDRQTPLTVCAERGHLDALHILLERPDIDIHQKGRSGRSALSFAAGNGHQEIVEALLQRGALQMQDLDNIQWTPLFWSARGDHAAIVKMLLKQPSININHVDAYGRSALCVAAAESKWRALRILLRHPSVDINLKDNSGRSPLLLAAGNGHFAVVDILMHKKGIDKGTSDVDGRNAISWACQGGHTKVLHILLKNECEGVDDADANGWTPLFWGLHRQCPEILEALLMNYNVRINRQDRDGNTALIFAAKYGFLDVVKLLVSWRADVYIKNHEGRSAADVAAQFGYTEVWEYLEAHRVIGARKAL